VAILDADKEGFLRSERSLIQTIGRAARHLNGRAILYADRITDSMRRAIDETERRRAKQIAFNTEKGITPKGVFKKIRDLIDGVVDPQASEALLANAAASAGLAAADRSPKDLARELTRLEKAMHEHARSLEFEKAAQLRDQLVRLKEEVFGVDKLQDSIEKAFV
jgi:excinuclease ABC subunit B